MPAVEDYDTMGLSADLVEKILNNYETELVGAAHERRARELLKLSRRDTTPTAAQAGSFGANPTHHSPPN